MGRRLMPQGKPECIQYSCGKQKLKRSDFDENTRPRPNVGFATGKMSFGFLPPPPPQITVRIRISHVVAVRIWISHVIALNLQDTQRFIAV